MTFDAERFVLVYGGPTGLDVSLKWGTQLEFPWIEALERGTPSGTTEWGTPSEDPPIECPSIEAWIEQTFGKPADRANHSTPRPADPSNSYPLADAE